MDPITAVTIVIGLTAILSWISLRWLKTTAIGVPALSAIVALALISGGSLLSGIRQWCANLMTALDAPDLFLDVMVPLLLFTSSMCFGFHLRERSQIASAGTAIFRWLLTTFAVAGVVKYISQGAAAWSECVLFGSLISATDPIGQVRLSSRSSAPERANRGLITESLINSTLAASLCIVILRFTESGLPVVPKIVFLAIVQAGVGVILGIAAGWAGARATDRLEDHRTTVLVVGVLLFMAFLTSRYFGLAGPIEALASGLAFRLFAHDRLHGEVQEIPTDFWNAIADIENSVLFVLLGLWITANGINMNAIAIGSAAVLVILLVRFASTRDALLRLVRKAFSNRPSALFGVLGSYKGGIPIALAFAIPYPGKRSWILGATFIVALFSTIVHGGMIGWISHFGSSNADHPHLVRNRG